MEMKPYQTLGMLKAIANSPHCDAAAKTVLLQAANLIQSLQPRPIEEAPRDGVVLGCWYYKDQIDLGIYAPKENKKYLMKMQPTTFIPLSAITKLMESGE